MNDLSVLGQMLPFLIPVLIIEIILIVICLRDLIRRKEVLGGNKLLWVIVIVFVQIIGAVLYLTIGRKETPVDGD
jgi:branched-subunit amino acid transport protein AzlD